MTGLVAGIAARSAVITAVRTVPWKLVFDGALALAFLALLAWGIRVNDLRSRWQHQYQSEHAARLADRTSYENAQIQAQAQNKAQVQKVEQHYQRNSEDEKNAYLRDLAKLRAERVRPRIAAPQGSTGTTGTPTPDTGSPRIDENGLCVPASSDVCKAGAEIELRLMHLQNLFEQQSQVDPNK